MKVPAIVCASLFALVAACGKDTNATTTPPVNQPMNPAPSNTHPNTQMQNQDQDLATRVRKSIDDDTALAPMAQDLQVTATGGSVTLRGSVANQGDKDAIGTKAKAVAGVQNVINNLTVKG